MASVLCEAESKTKLTLLTTLCTTICGKYKGVVSEYIPSFFNIYCVAVHESSNPICKESFHVVIEATCAPHP
jgi:hypothetical protein